MGEWFLFAGEFVKYHDLKDKDELIVYRDGVGKLVRAFYFEFFEFWRTRICFEVPIMSREGGGALTRMIKLGGIVKMQVIRAQKWSSSASRTGSGCGPYGYKGKSTGKRSPKALTRSNSAAARTDVSSSSAQVRLV